MKKFHSLAASLATSLSLAALFYLLAVIKNVYSNVDIACGMFFVFILSFIVSASIWPSAK
ncbi:MAG: hypothetical protein QXL78_07140 [Methanocellales archaeon]